MSLRLLYVSDPRCLAGDAASDYHTVGSHELNRVRRRSQTDVSGDSVRRVFFLHVGPYLHVRGADHSTIT